MSFKILAINPGSTTTKLAIYEDEKELFVTTLTHTAEELAPYKFVAEQFEFRKNVVLSFLKEKGFDINELSAVVGRGGCTKAIKSGAYRVNDLMLDRLKNNPIAEHASNLGAIIAHEIASIVGVNAYIYDGVMVDEFEPIAKVTGIPEIVRKTGGHPLNNRAISMKYAQKINKKYSDLNLIVAHLGGGITVTLHKKGKMIDNIGDDFGPFSPERSGRISPHDLIDYYDNSGFDNKTMHKKLRGGAGLKAYFNTTDARDIEKMIHDGNKKAALVYEAIAYNVSKGIGEMAAVAEGDVDAILITGGMAHSKMLTDWIIRRVKFIAPVDILPGEKEMEALSLGTLRVLRGEEQAREYTEE